jgi:hypothetical protein
MEIRQLTPLDAEQVESVFDSQPKLMLKKKSDRRSPYSVTFRSLLSSGAISWGAFIEGEMKAFAVGYKWSMFPIGTLVMMASKPDGKIFNPERTGLAQAVDATLDHLIELGAPTVYFVRAHNRKWTNSLMQKRFGKFGSSYASAVEYISAGNLSKHQAINDLVLNRLPPSVDSVLVCLTRPTPHDF